MGVIQDDPPSTGAEAGLVTAPARVLEPRLIRYVGDMPTPAIVSALTARYLSFYSRSANPALRR